MKTLIALSCLAAFAVGAGRASAADQAAQLSHAVFFELNDASEAAVEHLVAGCKEYLSGHEGTVYFSVGTRAPELNREVNDQAFHVSVVVVFGNIAAHDAYQTAARHLEFIEKHKDNWKSVRVFDSYLAAD